MIAILLFLFAATSVPAVKGTLCLSDSKACVATEGTRVDVEPAEKARAWVWTSADMSRVVFGTLEEKAGGVDLAPKHTRRVTLSLHGSTQRGWPSDVSLAIREGKETRWEAKIPLASVKKLRELVVPEGRYLLHIGAPRHHPYQRPVAATGDMDIGAIELRPLPAIRGRVVRTDDGKRVALAEAQIARGDGKLLTTTRHDGSFDAELTPPIPQEVLVFHPGVATRVVALRSDRREAPLDADNDLGEIVMESGVQLAVRIVRSADVAEEKLRVRLLSQVPQKHELVPISSREVPANEEQVTFADLAKGRYVVVIEGDGPLEFLSSDVEVKDEQTTESIDLRPYRLEGTARFGEEPLRDGTVGISWSRMRREIKLPIDEDGRFGGVMWQHGSLHGWVNSSALGSVVPMQSPEMGTDPSTWNIALRRRLIEGRVFDAETRQPLRDASMSLAKQSGEGASRTRLYTSVDIREDGRYSIAAIDNGTYDIKVEHRERVPLLKTIELREADATQAVDFALQRGVETKIELTWASGSPVAGATVIEGVARDGHNPLRTFMTDPAGRLTISSERGEKRTLFVRPREGSLAVVVVAAGSSAETMRAVVPGPVGSIAITFRNREGKPEPALALVRYNGDWLPQSVVGRLPNERPTPGVLRFTRLPAGTYEIWGVRGSHDNAGTFAPPATEPVRVGLAGGEQHIDVSIE